MSKGNQKWLFEGSPLFVLVLDEKLECHDMASSWRNRLAPELLNQQSIPISALFELGETPELFDRFRKLLMDGKLIAHTDISLRLADQILPCKMNAWRAKVSKDDAPCIVVSLVEQLLRQDTPGSISQLQSQHSQILDSAGEGVYGLDIEGRITFGNAAAAAIVGWQTEKMLGQKSHDVHHHSYPDGSEYPRDDCPIYAALKDGEVHYVDNEVFWHADGSAVPVEYTSTPLINDGNIEGAVVVFKNISKRKILEQQREAAFKEIKQLKEQLEQERDYLRDELNVSINNGEIIGQSQALKRTLSQITAVANTPANVLILGESGTGKELIARAIHQQSDRAKRPLVKVNCASIPKELFESEFFGHVKGAFTGAHQDRIGRMQLADGGTLFLDEVGEIPLSQQGKLLRALQEHEFERVGDDRTKKVDVRIVAATNRNLEAEVEAGRFREDLYYRLSVFPVKVPALRDRLEDIAPLAINFIHITCKEFGRDPLKLTNHNIEILKQHNWPGNIRELKNVIERSVIISTASKFNLDLTLPGQRSGDEPLSKMNLHSSEFVTDAEIQEIEKSNMIAALRHTNWQIWGDGGTAQLLGIKPSTLAYRMKGFGIEKKKRDY